MTDEQGRSMPQRDSRRPPVRPPGLAEIDDRQIDRLVDGELTETERRELLLALDRHPDGWRRCALAFLEAQCWREALHGVGHAPHAADKPSAAVRSDRVASPCAPSRRAPAPQASSMAASVLAAESKVRRWFIRAAATLAMAVSLLAAAMFGAVWQQWRSGPQSIAQQPFPADTAGRAVSTTEKGQQSQDFLAASRVVAADEPEQWQTVTLALHDGSGVAARPVQLPVREHDHFEEELLEELPAAIPPDIREGLESVGCRVVQQRQWMPLPLEDGRMLVVPVDSVELRFVGNQQ